MQKLYNWFKIFAHFINMKFLFTLNNFIQSMKIDIDFQLSQYLFLYLSDN